MTLAGLPATIWFEWTFFVTTAPAPTRANLPIVIPPKTVALAPILAPFSMFVLKNLADIF